jgi:hypothetical protein
MDINTERFSKRNGWNGLLDKLAQSLRPEEAKA